MSTNSNLTNGIRYVVSDAVPDPPRFSSSTDDNADKKAQTQDSSNESETPRVSSDNNPDSTTGKANNARTGGAKKSSKSKRTTNPAVTLNIVNSQNVKIGPKVKNVYNFNNIQHQTVTTDQKGDLDSEASDCKRSMLPHVEALSSSALEMTREDMLLVKNHMGHGWKRVAKHLGYSKGQVEQFLENYGHRDEVVYQILLDWKQSCSKSATLGRLISAMWLSREYECAEMLAAAHSSA